MNMNIITTREIRKDTKAFFELAEKERVSIKRGKKYINLLVSDNPAKKYVDEDWIKEFMAIPAQYRVNPFDLRPSGDLFFADKRNIDHINNAIDQAKKGQVKKLSKEDQGKFFSL